MNSKKWLSAALVACGGLLSANAQTATKPVITPYDLGDRCYIEILSANGLWGLTAGTQESGAASRMLNLTTGKASEFPAGSEVSDVTNDGKIVVGSHLGKAGIYDVAKGAWEYLPVPNGYATTTVSKVTPDGRYAVGFAMKVTTDIDGSIGLVWDLQTKQLLELTNLPKRSGLNSEITGWRFSGISEDGRYLLGNVDWNLMLNSDSGLFLKYDFVYDRENNTWRAVGYKLNEDTSKSNTQAYVETEGGYKLEEVGKDLGPWYRFVPLMTNLYMVDGSNMSRNGHYIAGTAWFDNGEESFEYPYLYNVLDESAESFPDASGAMGTVVTNDGTVVAATPSSTPVREALVRGQGYWFPLSTVLNQKYDFNFYDETGYDNTGTPTSITVAGNRLAMMPDPYSSYILDLPESLKDMASGINLLGMYNTDMPVDATMSQLKEVNLTFQYNIESLTTSNGARLEAADGTVVANSVGVIASARQLTISFRRATLEAGKEYNIVLPAGSIRIVGDDNQKNPEIKIPVKGRANETVKVTKVYPADGASINVIDYNTNPVIITFDCQLKKVDGKVPLLYRKGEETVVSTLNAVVGGNQLYIYPTAAQNLYKGMDYRVEIPAGIVTDLSDNGASEALTINYTGTYEREVPSDIDRLFFDDFSLGLNNFLLYDGDQRTPNSEMANWQFTKELPWSLVAEDDFSNWAAASHSMYSPAGQSDDWMVIPRLHIQDKNCRLHFKAQSYASNKSDVLKVLVWENSDKYETLDAATIAKIKSEGKVVFDETLVAQQPKGTMAGNWKDYSVPLSEFIGKDIYIAFWNNNDRQSAIFLDDVEVTRGLDFFLSTADTETSVVNQASTEIKAFVVGNSIDKTYDKITATLLNGEGKQISQYSASALNLKKGSRHSFTFPDKLPLTVGESTAYSVKVKLDNDELTAEGTVNNLAFQPYKRVVLEEKTGIGCGNCPRGHIAIERMKERFGTHFIPVAIHSYPGDPMGSRLSNYTDFLNLSGAPSGQVNRSYGVVNPQVEITTGAPLSDNAYFNMSDYLAAGGDAAQATPAWEDYVAEELATPAEADIKASSVYNKDKKSFDVTANVKYAMNAKGKNLNIFAVVVEDHLFNTQSNYLASSTDPAYGDWGKDGKYGQATVNDYEFFDVARSTYGVTYQGTGGLLPTDFKAGELYKADLGSVAASRITNPDNCRVVVMLIDPNTGKIINAHVANTEDGEDGVDGIYSDGQGNGPSLYMIGSQLHVQGMGNVRISAYTLDGIMVADKTVAAGASVNMGGYKGLLVIKATDANGSTTLKTLVK